MAVPPRARLPRRQCRRGGRHEPTAARCAVRRARHRRGTRRADPRARDRRPRRARARLQHGLPAGGARGDRRLRDRLFGRRPGRPSPPGVRAVVPAAAALVRSLGARLAEPPPPPLQRLRSGALVGLDLRRPTPASLPVAADRLPRPDGARAVPEGAPAARRARAHLRVRVATARPAARRARSPRPALGLVSGRTRGRSRLGRRVRRGDRGRGAARPHGTAAAPLPSARRSAARRPAHRPHVGPAARRAGRAGARERLLARRARALARRAPGESRARRARRRAGRAARRLGSLRLGRPLPALQADDGGRLELDASAADDVASTAGVRRSGRGSGGAHTRPAVGGHPRRRSGRADRSAGSGRPPAGDPPHVASDDPARDGVRRRMTKPVLRRLVREARPFWWRIAGVLLISLLATPLVLLLPIPLKVAVDSVLGSRPLPGYLAWLVPDFLSGSDLRLLLVIAALQVLIVLLVQLQTLAQYVAGTQASERMTLAFRSRMFRHAQRLSLAFHDSRGTMDSVFRIQWDAPALKYVMIDGLVPFVSAVVLFGAMLTSIARIDWQLCAVALAISPFFYLYGRAYNRRMRDRYVRAAGLESGALGVVQEVLSAFRVVKAFGREDMEEERFLRHAGEGVRARIRLAFAESAFGLLVNGTTALVTGFVLVVGFQHVQSGRITLGQLLVVLAYLAQLYHPLETISRQAASLQSSLASAQRAFELIDAVPDVVEHLHARPLVRARGRIELDHASFAYDGARSVIHDVSLLIEPGTRIGIAGPTGAGKTTLLSLLMRFYEPTSGRILLDDVDLREYRLRDLRDQFALVLQEPVLFSTSIAENIAYARDGATRDEIVDAARAAAAHEFIAALPAGYETVVGERGMTLSGGERQRIALARAFLKDAPILLLDEPTSSVDVATEAAIVDAMVRLMAGRTTLMIAHRLSTLDVCAVRVELAHGRLVDTDLAGELAS